MQTHEYETKHMFLSYMYIFWGFFGTLIIIWENLGPRNKLIIFYISLEWPKVLKNAAKMRVGLNIYFWNPT